MPRLSPNRAYKTLAFDPGERTGFVLVRVGARFNPVRATPSTFKVLDQGVLTTLDVWRHVERLVGMTDVVTYEVWRLYADHANEFIGSEMPSSQVIGAIRYETWRQRKGITSQGASVKKRSVASMPQWLRDHMALSSEQHDQDAIMHAWYDATERWREDKENVR